MNRKNQSALLVSVSFGYFDITKMLVEANCILNSVDTDKNNVLHLCCLNGHLDLLKYLVERAPSLLKEVNNNGKIPKELCKDADISKILEQEKTCSSKKFHGSELLDLSNSNKKVVKSITQPNSTRKSLNSGSSNITNIVNQLNSMAIIANSYNNRIYEYSSQNTKIQTCRAGARSSNCVKFLVKDVQKTQEISQFKSDLIHKNSPTSAKSSHNSNTPKNTDVPSKQIEFADYEHMTTKIYKIGGASSTKKFSTAQRHSASSTMKTKNFSSSKKDLNATDKSKIYVDLIKKDIDAFSNSHTSPLYFQADPSKTFQSGFSLASASYKCKTGELSQKGFQTPQKRVIAHTLNSENSKHTLSSTTPLNKFCKKAEINTKKTMELDVNSDMLILANSCSGPIYNEPLVNNISIKECNEKQKEEEGTNKLIESESDEVDNINLQEKDNEDAEVSDLESSKSQVDVEEDTMATQNVTAPIDNSELKLSKSDEVPENNALSNTTTHQEKVGPSSFICHALLGRGSFGEVYLVEKLNTNSLYAMKILSKDKIMGN